uniref:Uncharacterized protein n=1 Tax=Anguilla anguilla TaxID=7936 RepID=A0A0E9SKE8_ANGAN
MITTTTTIIGL